MNPSGDSLHPATPNFAVGEVLLSADVLSAHVSDLVEATEIRAGVSVRWGAVIHLVAPEGRAARAGLLPGDVVLALNGRPIRDARHFVRAVDGCDDTREMTFSVLRRQDITTVHVPSGLPFDARPTWAPQAQVIDW